ncbi:ribonuclease H-like domain-containing protein [Blautia schinkii]|nr:ribonuclease H-like domain-containing protein [Blautia schinkii]
MIVKKMPIFQGFPDFESVKNLSSPRVETKDFKPLFYDIETTGLSRNSTFLYLIGAIVFEEDNWQLHQWMCENEQEESLLLQTFSTFAQSYNCTIQYNGNHFDQPYIEARCRLHGIPVPFEEIPSLDLYQELKPVKALLKLPKMRQPDLEAFLDTQNREYCDGRECIKLYRSFLKKKDTRARETVLGHNEEDLIGLGRICTVLSYLSLYEGTYEVTSAQYDGEKLLLHLSLEQALPKCFSNGSDEFYITGEGTDVRLSITTYTGRVRQYYENYKDYDYLPGEDMAVPKSLSAYLDKSLKEPATAANCYTYVTCDNSFLENKEKVKSFLQRTLPTMLKMLK